VWKGSARKTVRKTETDREKEREREREGGGGRKTQPERKIEAKT